MPGDPPRDRRSNRRSFTDEEKLAIVMEAEQPGVSVAAVCHHHDIATSMVFRWRIQFGYGPNERARLAAVKVTDKQPGASATPVVLQRPILLRSQRLEGDGPLPSLLTLRGPRRIRAYSGRQKFFCVVTPFDLSGKDDDALSWPSKVARMSGDWRRPGPTVKCQRR